MTNLDYNKRLKTVNKQIRLQKYIIKNNNPNSLTSTTREVITKKKF